MTEQERAAGAGPGAGRALLWAVIAPSLLLSVAVQGLLFLLPLYVLELGGGAAVAAALVGLRGLGMLLMDLPAGLLAARFGDKQLMLGACLASALLAGAFALTREPLLLGLLATLLGASTGGWLLGRLSYVTDHCPAAERGRIIAVLAGTMRMGSFAGPAAGGLVAGTLGWPAMFCGAAALGLAASLLVLRFARADPERHRANPQSLHLPAVAAEHRRALATAGSLAVSLMLMRGARPVLVSLYGHALGLDTAAIGLIYSVAAGIDMLLFYPAGLLMDRKGRLWAAVPSLLIMSLGCLLLPLGGSERGLLLVAVLLGIGNGVSTGVVMTVGSDLAPAHQRGAFLGLWRVLSDAGMSAGPMLVSALVQLAGLAAASTGIAVAGLLGAVLALTCVPETRGRHRRPQ